VGKELLQYFFPNPLGLLLLALNQQVIAALAGVAPVAFALYISARSPQIFPGARALPPGRPVRRVFVVVLLWHIA